MRCTTLRGALLVGEDDGHGPVDECMDPAALSPGATGVALGLGAPGPADPLGSGSVESGLLVAAPGVPVVPELGSLGELSLVEGDGVVVVGVGLVDVGPGELLVLVGGELLGAPERRDAGRRGRAAGQVALARHRPGRRGRAGVARRPRGGLQRRGAVHGALARRAARAAGPACQPPRWRCRRRCIALGMTLAAKAPPATTKIARAVAVTGRSQRRPGLACPGAASSGRNRSISAQKISQAVPKAGTAQPVNRTAATENQPAIEENDSSGEYPSRSLIRSSPSADGSTDSAAACRARRRMSS